MKKKWSHFSTIMTEASFISVWMLREMAEYLGSGMPRILKVYPREAYTFSSRFIRTTFPISREALDLEKEVTEETAGKNNGKELKEKTADTKHGESGVESGVESAMALKILYLLNQKTSGKQEIAGSLGKERPSRYLSELIARLMREEIIAMTIPDKPNSRLQKYRLTSKGKALLAAKS